MQTKYLILILGLLIVILAHSDRGRKAGGSGRYIKSILGIENGSGRRIKGYDYIRVLAVIAVIGTHVVQSDTQLSAGSPGWIGLRIAETAFLTCNVLFVMLSGALLLNRGEEPVASFYRKRVFRVVIPMAVYYMFYLYMGLYHSGLFNPANWLDAGRRFLSGPSDWNPHFWLMYVHLLLSHRTVFQSHGAEHVRPPSDVICLFDLCHERRACLASVGWNPVQFRNRPMRLGIRVCIRIFLDETSL